MAKSVIKNFDGANATISWDRKLCLHMAECNQASGDLFVSDRRPWCNPDKQTDEQILNVIKRCPSGALSVVFKNDGTQENNAIENTITVVYGGPLLLQGELEIQDAPDTSPGLKFRAALCRCGQSKNKPFCDNSHIAASFKDAGAVGETGDPSHETGGPLTVALKKNGPLRVTGNLRIVSGSGRSAWQGRSAVLCRCGLSQRKPFCDGAHRAQGWQDD